MKRICYSLVLLLFANYFASAQELLLGLEENPLAKPQPQLQSKNSTISRQGVQNAPSPLTLPFIDDFSNRTPYPKTNLWQSNGVYVNNNYAINMPTLGVATFDALDDKGRLYTHLTAGSSSADSLTSLPIDLAGAPNVVLSFFYEPGGVGDMPGMNDYLVLEFYDPSTDKWTLVWQAYVNEADSAVVEKNLLTGTTTEHKSDTLNRTFIYTALAIDAPEYLQDGFRFRFVNFVTLVVNKDAPGRASNADIWHLDFVYLDRDRDVNDTNLPDVAICVPQHPLTLAYESIPASHLSTTDAQRNLFGDPMVFNMTYRNLGWGTKNITRRFAITPLFGSTSLPEEYIAGSENIFAGETQERSYEYDPYNFTAIGDSAVYEVQGYLITDVDMTPLRAALRGNDTTSYLQKFYDYYAYDDGTAENGYGLYGNRTDNGRVAVQYSSYKSDSLRGVYMYFNLAKDTANAKSFKLAVWADNNGIPGTLLYSSKVDRPAFRDSMNAFVAYKFAEPIFMPRNQKFYVGWMQVSEGFLNIGYDANRYHEGVNFYSLSSAGLWLPSEYNGALMIRPIFCTAANFPDDFVPPPAVTPVQKEDAFMVYPNPVSNILYLRDAKEEEQGVQPPVRRVEIYNMQGALVLSSYANDGSVAVSSLNAGMYMVRVLEGSNLKAVRKIIVTR